VRVVKRGSGRGNRAEQKRNKQIFGRIEVAKQRCRRGIAADRRAEAAGNFKNSGNFGERIVSYRVLSGVENARRHGGGVTESVLRFVVAEDNQRVLTEDNGHGMMA